MSASLLSFCIALGQKRQVSKEQIQGYFAPIVLASLNETQFVLLLKCLKLIANNWTTASVHTVGKTSQKKKQRLQQQEEEEDDEEEVVAMKQGLEFEEEEEEEEEEEKREEEQEHFEMQQKLQLVKSACIRLAFDANASPEMREALLFAVVAILQKQKQQQDQRRGREEGETSTSLSLAEEMLSLVKVTLLELSSLTLDNMLDARCVPCNLLVLDVCLHVCNREEALLLIYLPFFELHSSANVLRRELSDEEASILLNNARKGTAEQHTFSKLISAALRTKADADSGSKSEVITRHLALRILGKLLLKCFDIVGEEFLSYLTRRLARVAGVDVAEQLAISAILWDVVLVHPDTSLVRTSEERRDEGISCEDEPDLLLGLVSNKKALKTLSFVSALRMIAFSRAKSSRPNFLLEIATDVAFGLVFSTAMKNLVREGVKAEKAERASLSSSHSSKKHRTAAKKGKGKKAARGGRDDEADTMDDEQEVEAASASRVDVTSMLKCDLHEEYLFGCWHAMVACDSFNLPLDGLKRLLSSLLAEALNEGRCMTLSEAELSMDGLAFDVTPRAHIEFLSDTTRFFSHVCISLFSRIFSSNSSSSGGDEEELREQLVECASKAWKIWHEQFEQEQETSDSLFVPLDTFKNFARVAEDSS